MSGVSRRRLVKGAGVVGAALVAGCAPLPWQAQPTRRVPRVGLLDLSATSAEVFREALRELGYVEGDNIAIEHRYAEGGLEQTPELAAELVRLPVDVLVTSGGPALRAARPLTETIPIVMIAPLDPVAEGFVASLARPGGNVTGVTNRLVELTGKRLELLKEALPGVTRVGALVQLTGSPVLHEAEAAAIALGLQLERLEVRSPDDFERAFEAAGREHIEALLVLASPLTFRHYRLIAELAAARQLPATFTTREFVEAGGLMAYGPSNRGLVRRAAYYVDKILKGAKPADLPIEQPHEIDFVINLGTARALGLTIPEHVLVRATEVIA